MDGRMNKLISKLKLIILYIIRFVLKIFQIFPVQKNKIVFISFTGQSYSCSPKYISEYVAKAYPDLFKIVWVLNDSTKYASLKEKGIEIVRNNTLSYLFHVLTAKFIISNNAIASIFPPFKKNQYFINTWHGGGAYKRVGNDVDQDVITIKKTKIIADQTSLFLSSNHRFSTVMSTATQVPYDKMWEIGLPRNDILFHKQPQIITKVKKHFHLPDSIKMAIYAPTYRGKLTDTTGRNDLDAVACLKALEQRFGGEWRLLYRSHYLIDEKSNSDLQQKLVINASNYEDMQELLCACDVLITDYSSSMWDFSLTGKPCFIYATDVAKYQQERDFYTPMNRWPFPIAETNEELSRKIICFNEDEYQKNILLHHADLGICETGKASELVGNFIYEKCYAHQQK